MDVSGSRVPPTIDAERCVHALSATAGCRACVDACPASALQIDETALRIDEGLCTSCGFCRPVCPEDAIAHAEEQFTTIIDSSTATAYLACVCSYGNAAKLLSEPREHHRAVVPCLCALKEADLHRLADQGVQHLYVTRGASGTPETIFPATLAAGGDDAPAWRACPSELSRTQLALVELAVYRLRLSRGEKRLEVSVLEPEVWRRQVTALVSDRRRLDEDRRALFSGLFRRASSSAAPVSKLPATALARYAPVVDEGACVACHACARICPHGAIEFNSATVPPHYVVQPQACTGCGLCEDVCLDAAVEVGEFLPVAPKRVELVEGQCKRCGAPFYETSAAKSAEPGETKHCRICRGKPHQSRLFEVRS